MGQKVHPNGIRLGISTDWNSKWYADSKDFADYLEGDLAIREYLRKKLFIAKPEDRLATDTAISRIQIERPANSVIVTIHTARPGVVIGKKGEGIETLRKGIAKLAHLELNNVKVSIEEIRKPELDSYLVAQGVAQQLEKRIMFRRAMKRAVSNAMRMGALGIRINVSGRLNGAEIARMEWYREGRVPLHTFRADIDYGVAEALTTYGIIGIKVWIFKGEVFDLEEKAAKAAKAQQQAQTKKSDKKG